MESRGAFSWDRRVAVTAVLLGWLCLGQAVLAGNAVSVENQYPGTTDWRITNPACKACEENVVYTDPRAQALYGSLAIQGYASLASVDEGEPIDFYVSTGLPADYTLKIFRIGWYGGLGGRLMLGPIALQGTPEPVPKPNSLGRIECHWRVVYSLVIPSDWTSGVYLAKLETAAGKQSYIIFVVRDDSRPATYLYLTSDTTWQAYNEWGGSSLYTRFSNGKKTGYEVSFDRPYWRGKGGGDFLPYEINMVRWLEKEGYDVTYATDVDLDEQPDLLLTHQALLTVGHSEYWSWRMRANAERARERGVSLGFFAGNVLYWQIRFLGDSAGRGGRTMVAYKEDALDKDPYATSSNAAVHRYTTTFWSNLEKWKPASNRPDPVNRPEEELLGVETENNHHCCKFERDAMGDITLVDPAQGPAWLFRNTGLSADSVLPNMLGYEVGKMHGYQPVGTLDIAHSFFPKTLPANKRIPSDVSLYTAPSGALVFATGSIDWDLGLDGYGRSHGVVPAAQQMTANFLAQVRTVPSPLPRSARLPASVSASSSAVGDPAVNAGDGDPDSLWLANPTPGKSNNLAWIQLDFGIRRWVQRVHWLGAQDVPYPAASPTDYTIEISQDGVYWQTVVRSRNRGQVVNGSEVINQNARYVRLVTTKVNDGTGWTLGLFEFWAEGAPPPPLARLRTLRAISGVSEVRNVPDALRSLPLPPQQNYAWFEEDLGSRKQINRLKWEGTWATTSPASFAVQVSDDDANWNTVLVQNHEHPVVDGDVSLSAQGRYVRLLAPMYISLTDRGLQFSSFRVEGYDDDNVLAANATASAFVPDYPPNNAADIAQGPDAIPWIASLMPSESNNRVWFQLDFEARKQIDRVRWEGLDGSPYPVSSPSDYSIQVSDDGVHWKTVSSRMNALAVVNGDELLNAQGRYLRIVVTKVNDGTGWSLGYYRFWAEGY